MPRPDDRRSGPVLWPVLSLTALAALALSSPALGRGPSVDPATTEPILVDPSSAALQAELDDMARVAARGRAATPATPTTTAAPAGFGAARAVGESPEQASTLGETVSRLLPSLRAKAQASMPAPLLAQASEPHASAPPPSLSGVITLPADPVAPSLGAPGQPSSAQHRAWDRLRMHPEQLTTSPTTNATTGTTTGGAKSGSAAGSGHANTDSSAATRASYVLPLGTVPEGAGAAEAIDQALGTTASDASNDPWTMLAQPGAMHNVLSSLEGSWSVRTELNVGEGQAPEVITGTMTNAWTLGRRWLQQTYVGTSKATGPFQGQGTMGFDNAAGRFVASWADSLSTTMIHSTGTLDDKSRALTMTGSFVGPNSTTFSQRQTLRIDNPNRYTITMDLITPEGTEVRTATATYERLGSPLTATEHE